MRKTTKMPAEKIVKDIKRATIARQGHAKHDPERGKGISQGIYYTWSNDFMEADTKRLAGGTERAANTDEVKALRLKAKDLKEVVAEQTLELRLLKKA